MIFLLDPYALLVSKSVSGWGIIHFIVGGVYELVYQHH
jgi:hypothetical protein